MSASPSVVYLVIMDRGGVYGAFYDVDQAERTAEAIGGVVLDGLPLHADFRETTGTDRVR